MSTYFIKMIYHIHSTIVNVTYIFKYSACIYIPRELYFRVRSVVHFTSIQPLRFPFHECQIKFIRYSISQRARIYAYSSMCHNSARSAFCSIQSARRFPTCSLLSRRVRRESWRFKEREEETGSRYYSQRSSRCWFHKEDQSRKSGSERQTSSWLFVLSFIPRPIGSFAAHLLFERQDGRESALVKSHTIVF